MTCPTLYNYLCGHVEVGSGGLADHVEVDRGRGDVDLALGRETVEAFYELSHGRLGGAIASIELPVT